MEKWQVDWIEKHLVELYELTRCTVRLLTGLHAKKILDWDEVTELDDEVSRPAKVMKFYSILMTKSCYDILTEELGNCRQTEVEKILRDGRAEHQKQMKMRGIHLQNSKATGLEQSRIKKFLKCPEWLQAFLTSTVKKVLLISTMDVDVTITKIRDNLDRPVFVAEHHWHLRDMLENSRDLDLFILRCGETPDLDFVKEVITWSSTGAKAILLAQNIHLSLEHNEEFNITRDVLRWTDLKYRFQEELLEKQVKNQIGCEPRRVREILEEAGVEEELEDEKLILNLINDETPALFRNLPDSFSYYIKRKIRSRCVLNQNVIFSEETSDIFLFTGIGIRELSPYLSHCNQSSDYSWRQVNQLSVNYILLEHTDHFDQISEKLKGKGVHWIHHENGKFLWVKSGNGSMKRIQEATEGMTEENLLSSEPEFMALVDKSGEKYGNSPVLIADTPGMGKSTLLQNLARKMLEKAGTKIILFVAFSDLVNLLKANTRNSLDVSTETFENALLQLTTECGPELGKCVLKTMFSSSSKSRNEIKMELMLDAYDEINSDDLPLAKKLLTLIRNTYHSTRIWVATRPHLMHELENKLHVIGFTILPFDECDQEHFLVEFWKSEKIKQEGSSNYPNIRPDLVKFARHCLENVKHIWAKNSEKEDICGVPLQCLLIANVYLEDCLSFTNRDKLTTNSEPRLSFKVSSIKDLCDALIQKKLEIYTTRYAKELRPEMQAKLLNAHYFLALQLLFPKYAPLFKATLTFDNVPMTDILNLGIVESFKHGPPRFGHVSIPEFLVSRFIAEQLCGDEEDFASEEKSRKGNEKCISRNKCSSHDVGNLLFDGVLRTVEFKLEILRMPFECEQFENQALAFFLDSMLHDRSLDKSSRRREIVAGRSLPIKACIYVDHFHLFKALRTGLENLDTTILAVAVNNASTLFLEYICNKYNLKLAEKEIFTNHYTLLHVAVESREFSFVEYLLNCQSFGKLVEDFHPSIQDVVHAVVDNSNCNPKWLIEEKIQVLRQLVDLNRVLLEVGDINGSTPVLGENVHVDLILELLELGEDPLVKGVDDSTLLHSCSLLSGNDFHRVLMKLTEEQGKELVNVKTKENGSSVLHKIAENMSQPKKETLEHLLKLGANFASANSKGQTCLHVTVEAGNLEAARIFLELGMHAIVNVKDDEGRTTLDYLFLHRVANTEHFEEIGELLISYGATFTISTGGDNPLHNVIVAKHLFHWMMQNKSEQRPTIENVLAHPFFWNEKTCLNFLVDVHNAIDGGRALRNILNQLDVRYSSEYKNKSNQEFHWLEVIGPLENALNGMPGHRRKRMYDDTKLMTLVRFVRNIAMHNQNLPDAFKSPDFFEDDNQGHNTFSEKKFVRFIMNKFPDLIIFLFENLRREDLRDGTIDTYCLMTSSKGP